MHNKKLWAKAVKWPHFDHLRSILQRNWHNTWRHWQKFNGVCIFRHRVDRRHDMCCGGVQYAFGRRERVRSRYADLWVFTWHVKTNESGELLQRLHGAREHWPQDANDESGNNRETLGEPLCGPPAGSSLAGRRGSCGQRKKGGKKVGKRGVRESKRI